MHHYTLPRDTFNMLEKTLGSKKKAEILADTFESFLTQVDEKTYKMTTDKLEHIRNLIKEDLSKTLVTRELFEERFKAFNDKITEKFNSIDEKFKFQEIHFDSKIDLLRTEMNEKFKSLNNKFSLLVGLAILALTAANPTFVKLIEKLF